MSVETNINVIEGSRLAFPLQRRQKQSSQGQPKKLSDASTSSFTSPLRRSGSECNTITSVTWSRSKAECTYCLGFLSSVSPVSTLIIQPLHTPTATFIQYQIQPYIWYHPAHCYCHCPKAHGI